MASVRSVHTTWVFGYGSLVSRMSLGQTIGRTVGRSDGWAEAELFGWGRRWNYALLHTHGTWKATDGIEHIVTVVALGLVAGVAESANGVVMAVDEHELARLDHRERHYDRVDVTQSVELADTGAGGGLPAGGDRVVTYVPRPEAIAGYEAARDAGTAAIEQRYWDLVAGAFGELGPDRLERYLATTPAPDVPVLPVRRVALPTTPARDGRP